MQGLSCSLGVQDSTQCPVLQISMYDTILKFFLLCLHKVYLSFFGIPTGEYDYIWLVLGERISEENKMLQIIHMLCNVPKYATHSFYLLFPPIT